MSSFACHPPPQPSPYPLPRREGDETLRVSTSWKDVLIANGLDSLDALFAVKGESLGKPGLAGWRERIRLTLRDGDKTRTCYLKRYTAPPPAARREVRRGGSGAKSVAGVEWEWMQRLAADGIAAVQPVAFGEEFDGRSERRSAVLMEEVAGESLEKLADRLLADSQRNAPAGSRCHTTGWKPVPHMPARALVAELLAATADLVARFHARGYVHRDLYLSHIFYDASAPPCEGLCIIDLQRVLRPRWRRRRWIVKDLAALDYSTPAALVSRADRLRWLRRYLGAPKLDARARRLARAVAGKARKIARHDRRRK